MTTTHAATAPFHVTQVTQIQEDENPTPWLIHSLWGASDVGVLAGQPKLGKTWLGLEFAVSVASRVPCLGTFPVERPGPVLLYLAEDSLTTARSRIEGICTHRGIDISRLDLHLITESTLRLDTTADNQRLAATVEHVKPRLLLLDPFVRVHRGNENDSSLVSGILGELRTLQRNYNLAIILVHHLRKNGSSANGQSLRGSGDIHAWGDGNAYLTRHGAGSLLLTLEQRFHKPIDPLILKLVSRPDGSCPHLEISERAANDDPERAITCAVMNELGASATPISRIALRARLRLNNQRLGSALEHLEKAKRIHRTPNGWTIAPPSAVPF